jgi:acetylornithine deacetylase
MRSALDSTLQHLERLVACDSRNPPRSISSDGPLFQYLRSQLSGFTISEQDFGNGCINLLATRGSSKTLFNFHIDTVPANELWTMDPLVLQLKDERAYGLGACDIKGAAAAMLAAVNRQDGPIALLFSSDEEAGKSTCINNFIKEPHGFERVVVAEPTMAHAICAHRGIATATVQFSGVPGHASAERAMHDSAIHRAVRWSSKALQFICDRQQQQFQNLQGLRFNIGTINGGIKSNMIAAETNIAFGIRTLPGQDGASILQELVDLADAGHVAAWSPSFLAPALPDATRAESGLVANLALAKELNLPLGSPVDFWTEAALFGQAGLATVVFGSGDIAQAHSADEWVALEQLDSVANSYERLISDGL